MASEPAWQTSPTPQIRWCLEYVKRTYGLPSVPPGAVRPETAPDPE